MKKSERHFTNILGFREGVSRGKKNLRSVLNSGIAMVLVGATRAYLFLPGDIMRNKRFIRIVASALVLVLSVVSLSVQRARADLIPTEVSLSGGGDTTPRVFVDSLLDRQDVAVALRSYGVSPADVKTRLAVLSDEEVLQISKELANKRAGGDGLGAVIAAVIFIFVLLLITDIIGFTKVFPFTRSLR